MYCSMPDDLNTAINANENDEMTHSQLWKTKSLRYVLTNCAQFKTPQLIHEFFSVWQTVCGLRFHKVAPSEECEIKVTFLNNHDNTIDCPYKLNRQKGGTLAQARSQVLGGTIFAFIIFLKQIFLGTKKLGGALPPVVTGQRLAHAFYPGWVTCVETFTLTMSTDQKTVLGDGKYNFFSVATHELGHALGVFHSNEKDSVMEPFYRHGFSLKMKFL